MDICRSDGYICGVCAAESSDSLLTQPCGGIPHAGIEEALLGMHGSGATKSSTTGERREGGVGWRVEGKAQAFRRGEVLAVDGGDEQVDLLTLFVADYVGIRREGIDEAEWGGSHDGAVEDVGGIDAEAAYGGSRSRGCEGDALERSGGRGARLDFGAEESKEEAQKRGRDWRDALGAEGGDDRNDGEQGQCDENVRGPQPEALCGCGAERNAGFRGAGSVGSAGAGEPSFCGMASEVAIASDRLRCA